jgi:5'-nucleotidase
LQLTPPLPPAIFGAQAHTAMPVVAFGCRVAHWSDFRPPSRRFCPGARARPRARSAAPGRPARLASIAAMAAPLRKTVLIDMDNTLAQFDLEFGKRWVAAYPAGSLGLIKNRKHFELEQNFPGDPTAKDAAVKVMSEPGLFIAFEPADGCVAAVRGMVDAGLNVFFCTAPLPFQYEACVAEKYAWVRKHFGDEYLARIIVTRDKTVIKGSVLIDDKPKVTGACDRPEWTHLIYTQSYNAHITDKPRFTDWADWRSALGAYLDF